MQAVKPIGQITRPAKIRAGRDDKVYYLINYVVVTVLLLTVLYPIVYVISASFSSPSAIIEGKVWLFPVNPTLLGYKSCMEYGDIFKGFRNSFLYVLGGTSLSLVLTILAAYPLSRKDFVLRGPMMIFFAFTMWFSGGLIPSYLLVKDLGLLNNPLALILPSAVSVYNVIITRTFFQSSIPDELLESATLDGCSDIRFVRSIVLPLSKAIIAVNILFYAVGYWNAYFNAFIYLTDRNYFPLQIFLREILVMNEMSSLKNSNTVNQIMDTMSSSALSDMRNIAQAIKYSLIVLSSAPLVIAYSFVQKHFVKGVMIGALKG